MRISQSVSQSLHGPHSHSGLLFRAGWNLGIFFLSSGRAIALQDDVLLPFAFTDLLVGADLDENGPRR